MSNAGGTVERGGNSECFSIEREVGFDTRGELRGLPVPRSRRRRVLAIPAYATPVRPAASADGGRRLVW